MKAVLNLSTDTFNSGCKGNLAGMSVLPSVTKIDLFDLTGQVAALLPSLL